MRRGILMLAAVLVLTQAGPAWGSYTISANRLIYSLVWTDDSKETLIAVTRVDDGSRPLAAGTVQPGDDLPLHLNFFDKDCLVRNREDALTPLDVDVYVYSAFGAGIPKGALEIHTAPPGGFPEGFECFFCTEDNIFGTLTLIGEAVILDFGNDTMVGYSATGYVNNPFSGFGLFFGTFTDLPLAVPHFLAEVPGVLTNEIALAAVPCNPFGFLTSGVIDVFPAGPGPEDFPIGWCPGSTITSIDQYPSGSSDVFTIKWRMFDGNEEEASATSTFKCVLHASLSSIFGPVTTLGFLPPDEQDEPRILFYPYGWVRAAIEFAPTTAGVDNWGVAGMFRQQYTDGTFAMGEATNLWAPIQNIASVDGEGFPEILDTIFGGDPIVDVCFPPSACDLLAPPLTQGLRAPLSTQDVLKKITPPDSPWSRATR